MAIFAKLSSLALCVMLLAGCGGQAPADLAAGSDETGAPRLVRSGSASSNTCEDWSTIECGIELGSRGNVVDCARGVRVCQDGRYGACVANAALGVVSVQAPDVVLPSSTHTGVMALSGQATDCVDDPCNPYCHAYVDEPDEPISAEREDAPTGDLHGGSLQSSNLPPSFKNKGSLDAQCSSAPGSESWNEACQFDQHCVDGACAAWEPGESGACTGVDVTTPTTCVPSTGGTRALTVCNRGTKDAPAGIKCFGYSGGSPQFPNDDPGSSNRLLMTTQVPLGPGECETQLIGETVFHQNGIQSVACNPPQESLITGTIVAYPSASTDGSLPWTAPEHALVSDSASASVSPANPNGTVTGPLAPGASAGFGSDHAWQNPELGYVSGDGLASASPAAPAGGSGTVGPRYPGGFDNPAAASETAFSNPDRIYSHDGQFITAAPANPTTITTVTKAAGAHDASASWSSQQKTYASDAQYATAKLTAAGSADTLISGFGLNVPTNAVLDSFEVSVKWKTDVNSTRYTLSAQALAGAASTALGGALVKSGTYTSETTDKLTLAASSLVGVSGTHLSGNNLKVRLRFTRSNGNVADSTASVDFVQVTVKYHLTSTTASVAYRYFGLGSIPSNASVALTAEVKWKTSAVNPNVKLGLQLYKNWGAASQAELGSELTRTPTQADVTYADSTGSVTVSPSDLVDTSFAVRLRVVRSDGATNPDVTASIDYVRVTAVWSLSSATTTHSLFLKTFGLSRHIPENATITAVTSQASWKLSQSSTSATLGLQAYKAAGSSALGSEVVDVTSPTTLTTASQTVTAGVTPSDLSDDNFGVRVRVTRAPTSPDFTAYLDAVQVTVSWTAPGVEHAVTYGNFGLDGSLPSGATVTQLKTEIRWKSSVSTNRQELGVQLYTAGGVPLGAELVDTASPTSFTTRTLTLTGLALTPAELADGDFTVRVRSTRKTGSSNPDYTAYLEYVRVSATYTELVDDAVEECNPSNNWTATKLNPSPDACQDMSTPAYVPFTVTRVFQAVCPTGQLPTWRRFGYTTATPGDSSVEFRFRSYAATGGSCVALPAITSGEPAPLATASAAADPQVCLTTDPSCVVDLSQGLGAPGSAGLACLQMDAHGVPDASESPQLIDWTVLYDCLDGE